MQQQPNQTEVRSKRVYGEWWSHRDEASGHWYYYNARSKETCWELPLSVRTALAAASADASAGTGESVASVGNAGANGGAGAVAAQEGGTKRVTAPGGRPVSLLTSISSTNVTLGSSGTGGVHVVKRASLVPTSSTGLSVRGLAGGGSTADGMSSFPAASSATSSKRPVSMDARSLLGQFFGFSSSSSSNSSSSTSARNLTAAGAGPLSQPAAQVAAASDIAPPARASAAAGTGSTAYAQESDRVATVAGGVATTPVPPLNTHAMSSAVAHLNPTRAAGGQATPDSRFELARPAALDAALTPHADVGGGGTRSSTPSLPGTPVMSPVLQRRMTSRKLTRSRLLSTDAGALAGAHPRTASTMSDVELLASPRVTFDSGALPHRRPSADESVYSAASPCEELTARSRGVSCMSPGGVDEHAAYAAAGGCASPPAGVRNMWMTSLPGTGMSMDTEAFLHAPASTFDTSPLVSSLLHRTLQRDGGTTQLRMFLQSLQRKASPAGFVDFNAFYDALSTYLWIQDADVSAAYFYGFQPVIKVSDVEQQLHKLAGGTVADALDFAWACYNKNSNGLVDTDEIIHLLRASLNDSARLDHATRHDPSALHPLEARVEQLLAALPKDWGASSLSREEFTNFMLAHASHPER